MTSLLVVPLVISLINVLMQEPCWSRIVPWHSRGEAFSEDSLPAGRRFRRCVKSLTMQVISLRYG